MTHPAGQITINGKACEFRQGMTIYEAAREHAVYIPVLCRHEDLRPGGSCRICSVELEGFPGLVASCTQPAQPGMVLYTDSERVRAFRRSVLLMLLAQGRHDCSRCSSQETCVLRRLAREYGIERTDFPEILPAGPLLDDSNEMIVRNRGICIMCGLCVQACNEIQVNNAIGRIGRGFGTTVGPPYGMSLGDSECVFCGECVRLCPVGALSEKEPRSGYGQGAVRKVRTTCPYCGVGCQMDLNVRQGRIDKVTTPRMGAPPPNHGSLCVKGRFGCDFINHPDRLSRALLRRHDRLVPVDTDEALRTAAGRLSSIRQAYGPDAIAGLASARCTNEENYLFQKFFRTVIGTNNIDHCARMCHSPTVAGLAAVLGSGAMTNSIADIEQADCILVTGSNMTENHPVIGSAVKRAAARGASLVVVDPRRIGLVSHADLWLCPRPGSDIAWINGLANVMIAENLIDEDFIRDRTENFDAFRTAVARYTPGRVQAMTGIAAGDLVRAARLYGKARRATVLYAMGITQHVCGTATVRALANLALMSGNLGRAGCGINPLRGQNNVQGACDMGCLPNVLPGYQPVADDALRQSYERAWGCALPSRQGLTVPEMIERALEGSLKALVVMGENPLMSEPDSSRVAEALGRLDLLVCQDIFLNETGRLADVVLPAAAWAEKDGTFTSTERRVQRVRAAVHPPGSARSDRELLCGLADAMGAHWHYDGPEAVFEEIRSLVAQYHGITYARIEDTGLQWPCPDTDHPGTPVLYTAGFPGRRALFSAVDAAAPAEEPDRDYPFMLTTGRILYHYHTATMSGRSHCLSSRAPDVFIEVNPADARRLGIGHGSRVRVASRRGAIEAGVHVTERCGPGLVFVPFHYAGSAANVLTHGMLDPDSHIAEVKVCAVRIAKVS